jgi:SulP family sulfate permease
MFAIVESYKRGLITFHNLKENILSGIIVGVIALPLAMAFSIASGAKPENGIYTAIIAGGIVSLFGGSRVQISGPTGAFVVILASITAHYGFSGLQIATIMAGIFLLLMGVFRIGTLLHYIPYPVVVAFTSGIGCIIFIGQIKDFFGLPLELPLDASFYQKVSEIIAFLPQMNLTTTLISCVSLLLLILGSKYLKKIPSPLVVMVLMTCFQMLTQFQGVETIGSVFGSLPQELPKFSLPAFEWKLLRQLTCPALTIALLGAIESLLSAVAADHIIGAKHSPNKELIGQGVANIIAPFWGGFASTGAIARTMANIKSKGNSPLSGLIHCVFLLLTILIFAPFASYIPFSVLAAILFVVSYNMCDLPGCFHILRTAPKLDILLLVTTFLLTLFTNLVVAVFSGVLLALCFIVIRYFYYQDLDALKSFTCHFFDKHVCTTTLDDKLIHSIHGPLLFAIASEIESNLLTTEKNFKCVVLSLKDVPFIDFTGIMTLAHIIDWHKKREIDLYISDANHVVTQKIYRSGLLRNVEKTV